MQKEMEKTKISWALSKKNEDEELYKELCKET